MIVKTERLYLQRLEVEVDPKHRFEDFGNNSLRAFKLNDSRLKTPSRKSETRVCSRGKSTGPKGLDAGIEFLGISIDKGLSLQRVSNIACNYSRFGG
jgi:hypothetical protein